MFIILNEGFGGLGGFCEWRKDIKLFNEFVGFEWNYMLFCNYK